MTMPEIMIRALGPKEHNRLIGLGPFEGAASGPDPDYSTVVVAEDSEGEILGYWCAFNAVHVEPLWVAKSARQNGVGSRLWKKLQEVLEDYHVPNAFAIIMDEDLPTHLPMAHEIGFRRIPGSVLFVDVAGRAPIEGED